MPGATSLVELILKKWGDDIAGAAKELEEKVGFPESVANRIATGELPMDAESVARRADEQGYGETMLHGSSSGGYNRTHDIREIDPDKAGDKWGQDREGFFLTNDPVEADYYATTDSIGRTVDGTVYPLRYKSDSPMEISSSDDINLASEQPVGYWDERHGDLIDQAKAEGNDSISLLDYGPYEDKSHKMTVVLDPNSIRSPNAAFDPKYTGSNIMGGLALPVAAGLLAAGQSEDADASVASLARRGLRLAEGNSRDADSLFNIVDERGGKIGRAGFEITPEGNLSATQMSINKEHRGSGIMNEAYDAIEEVSGRKIEPSGALTDDGLKFWIRRDPDKMREYLSGSFDDARVNSIIAENLQRGSSTVPMLATTAGLSGGGLLAASLAAPEVKDSGMISAPRSETLFDLTMGARDLERRLEGSPASLLFPSGLVEYLETVNRREEDPNAMTRGMALLDVLPF